MISEVIMPQMGADMSEGTLLRWLKSEGDQIDRGEPIAEIETDKANIEIEAFGSGVLRKTMAKEGDTLPVGTIIGVIAAPDEDISKYQAATSPPTPSPSTERGTEGVRSDAPATSQAQTSGTSASDRETEAARQEGSTAAQPVPEPSAAAPAGPQAPQPQDGARSDGRVRASPVAKRLADEAGVDLSRLQGTGPDGRIVRRDVEAAQQAAPPARETAPPARPGPARRPAAEDAVEDVPLSRMRQAIARHMQQSKQTAPHYYLTVDIDMTEALRVRTEVNAALGAEGRITINDLIILACAKALPRHARFNAHWAEDHLQLHSQINIGIAVALDDGLVVPAVLDCAHKGLVQLSDEARDVATRAREGSLRPEEFSAGTFTISNLGFYGVDVLIPIINPPQVAILGIGAARDRPVVREGQVVIRNVMSTTLAADHRATDGAEGALFLRTLRQLLETPGLMLS